MICLRNVVELAKIAILSTAKSFVFFSFSFFNALVQHSRNFAIKKKQTPLFVFLLASVRLGVLEAGIFSENTETNTISGTQIIFIAKQMGAWLFIYIRYRVLAKFQFSLFGRIFIDLYFRGKNLDFFNFFNFNGKMCFSSQSSPHS